MNNYGDKNMSMDLEKYDEIINNDFVEFMKNLIIVENKTYRLKQTLIKRKAYYITEY
jgi:hypothetical protein